MTLLETALKIATENQWAIFPIHSVNPEQKLCSCGDPDCTNPGKHPRTPNGLMDATTDPRQIREWWGRWENANIGLPTGRNYIVVLDIDPRHGGDRSLESLKTVGEFPNTYTVETGGGGQHIYFVRFDGVKLKSVPEVFGKKYPGIDLKAEGGYVVAEGSLHVTGGRYRVINNVDLKPVPEWLEKLIIDNRGSKINPVTASFRLPDKISAGERNNILFRAASSFKARGDMTELERHEAIHAINRNRCVPPLPTDEVDQILSRYPIPTTKAQAAPTTTETRHLKIKVGAHYDLTECSTQAFNCLVQSNNPPKLFARALSICRIRYDHKSHLPVIHELGEPDLRGILDRCCDFVSYSVPLFDKKGNETKPSEERKEIPPIPIIQDILAAPEWADLPVLDGVTECPIIKDDGSIRTVPGYCETNKLYFSPIGVIRLPVIKENPGPDDVKDAMHTINDILQDFPFVDDGSKTNAIGLLISMVIRPIIPGCVPLALISKPIMGAGATLLCRIFSIVLTGREPAMLSAPKDPDEWEKKIVSCAREGRTVITFDNVEGKLYADVLSQAITQRYISGRILGKSEMVTLPFSPVWIANGINVSLGGDMGRRCYWIRIDPGDDRPWQRSDFVHKNLIGHVTENRGKILSAVFTLTRAWIAAGKPKPSVKIPLVGGFEEWRDTIGGILTHVNSETRFLENLETMYEQADRDLDEWTDFFSKWYEIKKSEPLTIKQVLLNYEISDLIPFYLQNKKSDEDIDISRSLGRAIAKYADRVFKISDDEKIQLIKGVDKQRAKSWKLIKFVKKPKLSQSELWENKNNVGE